MISLARALSFNGLANAFHIAAINGGRHVAPLFAGGTVFVAGDSGVTAVDAATGRPRWTRDLRAQSVNGGILDGTTVWVQATDRATPRDRLWRVDARTGHVTGSLTLPEFGAASVVAVGKQVWTMSVGGDLQVALKKG